MVPGHIFTNETLLNNPLLLLVSPHIYLPTMYHCKNPKPHHLCLLTSPQLIAFVEMAYEPPRPNWIVSLGFHLFFYEGLHLWGKNKILTNMSCIPFLLLICLLSVSFTDPYPKRAEERFFSLLYNPPRITEK